MKGELNINSKVLRDILNTLVGVMLIDVDDGYYYVTDPVLRLYIKRRRVRD